MVYLFQKVVSLLFGGRIEFILRSTLQKLLKLVNFFLQEFVFFSVGVMPCALVVFEPARVCASLYAVVRVLFKVCGYDAILSHLK